MTDALIVAGLIVVPVTVGVSLLTFRTVERPFLSLRVRYLPDAPAAPGGR